LDFVDEDKPDIKEKYVCSSFIRTKYREREKIIFVKMPIIIKRDIGGQKR